MKLTHTLVVASAAIALSGCQTIGDLAGTSRSEAPEPVQIAAPAETTPVPSKPSSASGANLFAGYDSERLLLLWGEPAMRRKDVGAELWTFAKPRSKCSILVYLYPGSDGRLSAARGEATPGGAGEDAITSCARANDLPSLKPIS